MTHIGTLIRQRRLQLKLSQVQVANFLGCTSQYIANNEAFKSYPSKHTLKKLCRILELDKQIIKKAILMDYADELDQWL